MIKNEKVATETKTNSNSKGALRFKHYIIFHYFLMLQINILKKRLSKHIIFTTRNERLRLEFNRIKTTN